MTDAFGRTADFMADQTGPVESLYQDYVSLVDDLQTNSPSGLAALNRTYNKHLLVAAASSLEEFVKRSVPEIFARRGREEFGSFISTQIMARGYAQLFGWKDETAQPFFSSFGKVCGTLFKGRLSTDDEFKREHESFMRLGNLRNLVVHNDYASYPIGMTPQEVIERYRDAVRFTQKFDELMFEERA